MYHITFALYGMLSMHNVYIMDVDVYLVRWTFYAINKRTMFLENYTNCCIIILQCTLLSILKNAYSLQISWAFIYM